MDIKIRTQNEMMLVDLANREIGVTGTNIAIFNGNCALISLGAYESEEECLKILDIIEEEIEEGYEENKSGIIIEMP